MKTITKDKIYAVKRLNAIKYEMWQNLLQNVYVNTIERKENFQIIFIVCNLYIY